MKKFTHVAVLAAGAGLLTGLMGVMGAGTATADTITCSDHLPAHTNGNVANDVPQQGNKLAGALFDTATCTTVQANNGLNGADNGDGS
ncbi:MULTISPECIES: hypothetical protein [Streptomyces]|uniref:hypothetical protein n=1 Tax=Streptomyces TaxID=1883 RepID=UPI00163BC934|nr:MULTISPECIES: hypothetical protein [Streptomyces]MBC2876608.1 hypothetical protein [Streptomyces sp. TYQ1024]UBI40722.1 hypothetical protein K7I03_32505 [Streptomyces mobaraensis]UKW33303.1 hypothetical protein MCU78_32430 [Streptomyces sp. TYQ1024]